MLFVIIHFALCDPETKFNIYEFNKTQYNSFRDSIEKNKFLITLATNNSDRYNFYKDFFNDIIKDISCYINEHININYSILFYPDLDVNYDATFIIYLPGMTEMETDIYPRLSVAFNTNKILKKCLDIAIKLRRLEKEQKSPEIARIKNELREIAKFLRNPRIEGSKREKLEKDYSALTDELMQYISEDKQNLKKLKFKLQTFRPGSKEYKKIENEIQKYVKNEQKYAQKNDGVELSPKKLEKIAEKNMINSLKEASKESNYGILKSAFGSVYRKAKSGITHIWKSATKKKKVDDL